MRPVDRNALAHGAAEQLVNRHVECFRLDVEAGVDQRRAGVGLQAAGRRTRLRIEQRVDGIDRARILADERLATPRMSPVNPLRPRASLYSDQPTSPSSVVTLRNEKLSQPPSTWNVSKPVIFMGVIPGAATSRKASN